MNRIIIVGNGFDRAHNLRTGYKEFIDDYWSDFSYKITDEVDNRFGLYYKIKPCRDNFVTLEDNNPNKKVLNMPTFTRENPKSHKELIDYIEECNRILGTKKVVLRFENKFFEHISKQCSLTNWLDIENEYYDELKKLLLNVDPNRRHEKVKELNKEWDAVKNLLEKHLINVSENEELESHQSIQDAFSNSIEFDDIATCKQREFVNAIFSDIERFGSFIEFENDRNKDAQYNVCDTLEEKRLHFFEKYKDNEDIKERYCIPHTLLLNFNYTKTAEMLYTNEEMNFEIINIHGELNSGDNPIIFGYGDELDDNYQKIEKTQDNDFLENIKSIKYHQTRNYRNLLKVIESGIYQVFVMGHSCGNSDRTLLNTLFEHDNCVSIKVFYRQFEDGSDDYSNLIRNISRNFNDKLKMRDIVVNRENCSPLVPNKEATVFVL